MAKKISVLLLAICLLFSFAACGSKTVKVKDDSLASVASNGGFLVETGKYVYFINGVESYSTTYKEGKVTKGALMRTEKANLAKLGDESVTYDTIVSRLVVSDDKNAGVYLYGEYFYYAVPSDENNKKGEVKNDQLKFLRTKADGSSTSSSITKKDFSHDAQYRFVQKGSNVYLIVYSTGLYVYDAVNCKLLNSYEDKTSSIQEILFDEENNGDVFYRIKPVNGSVYGEDSENKTTENFNFVYKLVLGESSATADFELVLDGTGKKTPGMGSDDCAFLTGATFDLIRYTGGKLYFSLTSLDSSLSSLTEYRAVAAADLKESNAKKITSLGTLMNEGDYNASKVFADGTMILSENSILFVGDDGLMVYDYSKKTDKNTDLGASFVYDSENIKSATLDFIKKEGEHDFLYYHKEKVYYKVDLTDVLSGNVKAEEFRINKVDVNTDWYKPEVVAVEVSGATHYMFIAAYNDTDYLSYVNVIDMTEEKAAYEEYIKDLTSDEDKAKFYTEDLPDTAAKKYKAMKSSMLGKLSSDDQKTVDGESAKTK